MKETMTMAQLDKQIANAISIPVHKAKQYRQAFLAQIALALSEGKQINLSGLGVLKPVLHKERLCRNPKTGEPIQVPAHKAVKFKASPNLKELVNS